MIMDTYRIEKIFKAVANKRRLTALHLLTKRKSISVNDLADYLKLSFRSTSKHLQVLMHEGFIEAERAGMFMEYRLASTLSAEHKHILQLIR